MMTMDSYKTIPDQDRCADAGALKIELFVEPIGHDKNRQKASPSKSQNEKQIVLLTRIGHIYGIKFDVIEKLDLESIGST